MRSMLIVMLFWTAALAADPCDRCRWTRRETDRQIVVANVKELFEAVKAASPGTAILVQDGEYLLPRSLDLARPGLTLAGKSGNRNHVLLRGDGMNERKVGVAISVSASDITIADLTVGDVGYHGIQIRGEKGASRVVVHGVRIVDTGQQLLKGSVSRNGRYADDDLIACSVFEYTGSAPSDYTNGIDVLAGKGWIVRDNRLLRIRGPESQGWKAGPAILFWANSQDTRIEGNTIIDSYRGIAFGLGPRSSDLARDGEKAFDHQGGIIRGNLVLNRNSWADEGIEVNAARDVRVEGNIVIVGGRLPWAIKFRFSPTRAVAVRNVTNRPIVAQDLATVRLENNKVDAVASSPREGNAIGESCP
jgi:hypothetical protein